MEKIVKLWIKYDNVFLSGLVGTLWISAVTVVLGTLLGMLVAFLRMRKSKVVNIIADAYIEVLRGTPILLQLYFFWIGLPKIMPFELCIYTKQIDNRLFDMKYIEIVYLVELGGSCAQKTVLKMEIDKI